MRTIKNLLQKRLEKLIKLRSLYLLNLKNLTDSEEFELEDIKTEIPYIECQIKKVILP